MPIPSRLPLSISVFALFFLLISLRSPFAGADELSVLSHPSKLQLPTGEAVYSSPGARPGAIVTCNRVHIRGLSRLHHPGKFAHALKVRLSASQSDAIFRIQTIELCFHRNASLGVGMCPADWWQKLSKDSWVQSMSPYENRILDIRTLPDPTKPIELSTEYEFLFHRLVFLVLGMVMMATARFVSESVVFYYGSAMTIGIIIVILIVLFQGMRLLPTGRKSSFAIFMYSSIVGVATFLLSYLSGLLRSILLELGIGEDMHNPLGIFLLVCLLLVGAWFGYWGVRRLVLTEDGLVDSSVAYFVEWAILIFAAVMILQSSLDTLLAAEALGFAIIISAIARAPRKLRFLRRLFKRLVKCLTISWDQNSPFKISQKYYHDEYPRRFNNSTSRTPSPRDSPVIGLTKKTPPNALGQENFYSTFHNTPERKRFSKEEWGAFTREQTKKALRELVSSPDFNQWAVSNAERIMVTPPEDTNCEKGQRRFLWF